MWPFIDQLIQQGVSDFFFAPGSRSTPLAVAASRHPNARLHRHFDERGLGFYALGCALGKEAPVAVITTSGTAVGNLLPSVMEAHHASIPLLLLTADRPPELREASANQTSDQIKIFQNFVRFQFDLDPTMPEKAIRSKIAEAVFRARHPHPGPVHINCPFREPLYPPKSECNTGKPILLEAANSWPLPSKELLGKGIVMIGRLPKRSDIHAALAIAKKLKWPVFADLLSSARAFPSPEQIRHFDYLLGDAPKADCVLHFGDRFTSKRLMEWLVANPPQTYLHISSHSHWNDPFQLITARIHADVEAVSFYADTDPSWLKHWQEFDQEIDEQLNREKLPFTETCAMKQISEKDLGDWGIFLANSMPIREAEWFLFPERTKGFFANRGLSGIDGNIATIAGLSKGLECPILGIVGDLTALHDLNSLPLLRDLPVVLVVSNNDGCGVFSHLAVADDPQFEKLWGYSHGFSFREVAKMFCLHYSFTDSEHMFSECLKNALRMRKAHLLEVATSRIENIALHRHLRQICSRATI
jgi:2-succinyl-5-enolpyruvyl-6-hydroxy-3-cyclohexene-1-carboxylate synthase